MSDRAIAGLILLAPTALCWWLAWGYWQAGEVYSGKTGTGVTREEAPKRFWAGVGCTAMIGLLPFGLAVLAFLS